MKFNSGKLVKLLIIIIVYCQCVICINVVVACNILWIMSVYDMLNLLTVPSQQQQRVAFAASSRPRVVRPFSGLQLQMLLYRTTWSASTKVRWRRNTR